MFNAAQQWEIFSSAQGNLVDEIAERAGATLGSTDPPRHDRLRALAQAAFTRRNLEWLIAPTRELAEGLLHRIVQRPRFDFIADFSTQVTVGVLFRMLGLPQPDHAEIRPEPTEHRSAANFPAALFPAKEEPPKH